jgi:hypothetical protein
VRRAAIIALVIVLAFVAMWLTGFGSHPLFSTWTMKIF